MTTTINSNGSKWAGEAPDSIETLLGVLAEYVLDRRHECPPEFGHPFISVSKAGERWAPLGTVRFHGNFLTLSHVFSIDTDEPELIERMTLAIKQNMERPDYTAQPSYQQRADAEQEYRRANDEKRDADRKRQARAVLGLEG